MTPGATCCGTASNSFLCDWSWVQYVAHRVVVALRLREQQATAVSPACRSAPSLSSQAEVSSRNPGLSRRARNWPGAAAMSAK